MSHSFEDGVIIPRDPRTERVLPLPRKPRGELKIPRGTSQVILTIDEHGNEKPVTLSYEERMALQAAEETVVTGQNKDFDGEDMLLDEEPTARRLFGFSLTQADIGLGNKGENDD